MPPKKQIKSRFIFARKSRLILATAMALILAVGSIFFIQTSPANAHAIYVRSDPVADSSLPSGHPPQQVVVWFAESIELQFSELSVVNSTDAQVDAGDTRLAPGENTALVVTLKPGLPDGTYTVNFKSVSADDGHVSEGAFTFNVGAGTGASLPVEATENNVASSADNLNFWTVSLRWLNYLMAGVMLGGFIFALLVWKKSAGRLADSTTNTQNKEFETVYGRGLQRIRELAWVGLWGLVFSWAGWVLYQSLTLSGQDLGQLIGLTPGGTGPQALLNLLFTTRYGIVWMARLGLIFFLFDALLLLLPEESGKVKKASKKPEGEPNAGEANFQTGDTAGTAINGQPQVSTLQTAPSVGAKKTGSRRKRSQRLLIQSLSERAIWWWSAVILSACILLTQSLTSHAASQPSLTWFTIVVDWAHLLSTSIWVGGLIALASVLQVALPALPAATGDRARLLALLVPTFSRLALLAMATLVLTGTISALTEFTDPGQLFSTSYGLSLVAKIVLLVLLLGLGGYNLLVVGKKMPRYAIEVGGKNKHQKEIAVKGAFRLSLNFRRTVLLEIILAVLAFMAAAFLTSNPPPRNLTPPASTSSERPVQLFQQDAQLLPDPVPIVTGFRE